MPPVVLGAGGKARKPHCTHCTRTEKADRSSAMENGAGKHGVHYDNAAPDFGSTDVIRTFVRRWKWLQIGSPGAPVVAMNWVVSLAGASILAAFVMASLLSDGCVDEDKTCDANTEFKAWQTWVTQNFSWLYIGTQNVWIAFILFIALSKYGTLKLGKKDDSKEFSDLSWFAMLFACGIGSGIWYWGVSEPMYYYRGSGDLKKIGFPNDDGRAQQAMNITYFHWGTPVLCVSPLLVPSLRTVHSRQAHHQRRDPRLGVLHCHRRSPVVCVLPLGQADDNAHVLLPAHR